MKMPQCVHTDVFLEIIIVLYKKNAVFEEFA